MTTYVYHTHAFADRVANTGARVCAGHVGYAGNEVQASSNS
jgi:hypothetical protein